MLEEQHEVVQSLVWQILRRKYLHPCLIQNQLALDYLTNNVTIFITHIIAPRRILILFAVHIFNKGFLRVCRIELNGLLIRSFILENGLPVRMLYNLREGFATFWGHLKK